MKYYHALALDGGGIRGILTAILLDRLEKVHPFLEQIDLYAGTSTGGVLALGLAAGYSPADLCELYELHAAEVFQDSLADDIADLGMVFGSEYSNTNLSRLLEERFGDSTLDDLPRRVLITAFDLDNSSENPRSRIWKPKFFHNFPGFDSDGDQRIVDVALRTSAAPTYFPIYQGYIDGGVIANNPAMCALSQAVNPTLGGKTLEDVVLLSMGTGINLKHLETVSGDWGLAQWARHLLSILLDGSSGTVHYQCRMMIGNRYRRVNPLLPDPINLDEIEKIPELRRIAEEENLLADVRWLKKHFSG